MREKEHFIKKYAKVTSTYISCLKTKNNNSSQLYCEDFRLDVSQFQIFLLLKKCEKQQIGQSSFFFFFSSADRHE